MDKCKIKDIMDQSEDSETDAAVASDPGQRGRFRIRVHARECVRAGDPREKSYVSVIGARRVVWLARRVQRLLGLTRPPQLSSRGHWLPPDEPLAPLLAPDDPVDVIPINDDSSEVNYSPRSKKVKQITFIKDSHNYLLEHKQKALQMLHRLQSEPEVQTIGDDARSGIQTIGYKTGAGIKSVNDEETFMEDSHDNLLEHKQKALQLLQRLQSEPEEAISDEAGTGIQFIGDKTAARTHSINDTEVSETQSINNKAMPGIQTIGDEAVSGVLAGSIGLPSEGTTDMVDRRPRRRRLRCRRRRPCAPVDLLPDLSPDQSLEEPHDKSPNVVPGALVLRNGLSTAKRDARLVHALDRSNSVPI